jgi:hypothetical protein
MFTGSPKPDFIHLAGNLQKPAQYSVHLTGGYAPRLQTVFLAQANSVKMALPRPSRQQVTHTVGRLNCQRCEDIHESESYRNTWRLH